MADPLEERRLSLLRTLRELDDERATGTLAEGDYRALRRDAELQAVAVLRSLKAREGSSELAAAVAPARRRKTAAAAPASRTRPLVGPLVAVAMVAAAIPLLMAGLANRAPGGLITGQAPPGIAAATSDLAFLEQQVQAHPGDVNARLDLAQWFAGNGRVQDAMEQYLAVVQLDPADREAHTQIGLLMYRAGLPEQGLTAVNQALQVDPSYPEALYARGLILLRGLDRPAEAASEFRAYLAAAPFGSHRAEVEALQQSPGSQP